MVQGNRVLFILIAVTLLTCGYIGYISTNELNQIRQQGFSDGYTQYDGLKYQNSICYINHNGIANVTAYNYCQGYIDGYEERKYVDKGDING